MSLPIYNLTLYTTSEGSGKALRTLYKALQTLAYTDYQLEIVNVREEPEKALEAGVVSPPMLVWHSASGDKKTKGPLFDSKAVRELLEINGQ